jgi:hypothetical protein
MLLRILRGAAIGAWIGAPIGFILGFFGPMIFMPGANQGPLIGIFFTGPLGFILGAIAGAIGAALRHRQYPPPPPVQ